MSTAEQEKYQHVVRLLGRVAIDETRVYKINATVNGWITRTMPFASGDFVKQHDVLATFYSPEFLSAGQALLYALNTKARVETNDAQMPEAGPETQPPAKPPAMAHTDAGHETAEPEAGAHVETLRRSRLSRLSQFNVNIQQYVDSLKNLGMGEMQIQEMIRSRKFTPHVDVTAPADAVITVRNLAEGQRFEKNDELYRLADLRRVWVLADMSDREAEFAKPGLQVRVRLPRQERTFTATVSKALPQFDPTSRTLKLRLEADNPDYALKPDMFVEVELPVSLPETLMVPADAVVDAGTRKTVFVDRGNGFFEPRAVQTGWRISEHVQILQGLMPGERIVTSGNFLLDSESRMKLAASGVHGVSSTDPVCGMAVDETPAKAAKRSSHYQGGNYFFCSASCKNKFDADPAKSLAKVMARHMAAAAPEPDRALDPVCNMKVDPAEAKTARLTSVHQVKTYFFCNQTCKSQFDANPVKFAPAEKR